MKHKQVLSNLVEFKLAGFEEIHSLINALGNKTIRQLVMELKIEGGDKIFIAIERLQ